MLLKTTYYLHILFRSQNLNYASIRDEANIYLGDLKQNLDPIAYAESSSL
jgi:hypothetical protein